MIKMRNIQLDKLAPPSTLGCSAKGVIARRSRSNPLPECGSTWIASPAVRNDGSNGFTLIELSIVLVIIGLIVGGVLVGRDLIASSSLRAQIGQLEKYTTAIMAFQSKYNGLPGDIKNATDFGFKNRGTSRGQGDGNGILEGDSTAGFGNTGYAQFIGLTSENVLVWTDLSDAKLIDGAFSNPTNVYTTMPGTYLPTAKIGNNNFIYTFSGGYNSSAPNGLNYFGLGRINYMDSGVDFTATAGLSVYQASYLDEKIDDGLPQSGKTMAFHVVLGSPKWANGSKTIVGPMTWQSTSGANNAADNGPTTTATPSSTTTCYDNNNVVANQQYSKTAGLNLINCALSFRF